MKLLVKPIFILGLIIFFLGLMINLSYAQTKEIVIDPEEVIGKYVTGDPEEYLDIKKDGIFYLKEKGKYYSIVGAPETTGKWEIEKDKIIFFHPLGIVTRGKIEPNVIVDEEGKIWFKEGSISQEAPALIPPDTQRIKSSLAHRIQRLEPLLSEGPPVRERDWVKSQLDQLTGAEWVIDNAIWLFELAQEQWQEARDFLAEADLENAQRRVIYAEATLLNAYTLLSAAYGVIDEGLSRAERVVWYYRKGAHESEKLVALLGFGPKGYEVASKLCLLDDFVVEGLTQGWEGASKTLAFRLVLDKLIDAGILKDSAVSDKVVYDNLRTALSDGEFMRTLITEFAAHELATEGIEKVVQSTLSWLEKHRGSFVDIDLGSGLTEEKFFVKPLFQEIEVKKEIAAEPITLEEVPEEKGSEIVTEKKIYTVQVGGFSLEKNALSLAKEIKDKGYQTYVIKGKTLYRVQVGEFKSYQEAQNILQKLKELGYYGYITTRIEKVERDLENMIEELKSLYKK